jgi:hypothetical protein
MACLGRTHSKLIQMENSQRHFSHHRRLTKSSDVFRKRMHQCVGMRQTQDGFRKDLTMPDITAACLASRLMLRQGDE